MIFLNAVWTYLLMSSPYLLMGLILSAIIHAFVPIEKVRKILGQKRKTDILYASLIGVPLPLCSCSVIPTSITLKQAGASNAATSAFLITTPESGIDSILVTNALMDLPMTILRPLTAFLSGLIAGGFQMLFNNEDKISFISPTEKKACCNHTHTKILNFKQKIKNGLNYAFVDLVNDLSFWMIIGILSGALIEVLIPTDFFSQIPLWQSKLLIISIGVPLYICASASTPIAASLVLKGLSPGSALLFLMVGPATNLSNIFVMQKFIGKKGILINLLVIITVALLMSVLTDWFYQNFYSINFKLGLSHDHESNSILATISGILVSGLLLKGLFSRYFPGKHIHVH